MQHENNVLDESVQQTNGIKTQQIIFPGNGFHSRQIENSVKESICEIDVSHTDSCIINAAAHRIL